MNLNMRRLQRYLNHMDLYLSDKLKNYYHIYINKLKQLENDIVVSWNPENVKEGKTVNVKLLKESEKGL